MAGVVQFKLVIKQGLKSVAEVDGHKINVKNISVGDLTEIIETEKFLERIFGYRFHIFTNQFEEGGENDA